MACGLGLVAEHAYRLTQQLDPRSEGRGVLQFKTGLKSIIKVVSLFVNFNFLKSISLPTRKLVTLM